MSEVPYGLDPTRLVAVVGMAGRFPPDLDTDGLWDLLLAGREAIRPVPADRWDASAQLDPELSVQGVGGFLDDVAGFDAGFFGVSPREAEDMDPQQRLMLEVAWRALEDGGVRASKVRGTRTGVYVGASWHDYEILRKERGAGATQHSAVGNALDVVAARVSYFLGLRGPSLTLETGCSSSLVALDVAGQALRAGDIDGALVGGVNLIITPDVSVGLTRFGGLSPEGRCKAFAADADGFVRAECVAALYLKRLDRALADGDRIRGVIVATAVNNDGGGDSLVTPDPAGQEDLLRRAYRDLPIPLDALSYVEAHGTGTGRGDPIEAGAIGRVLGRPRTGAAGPLAIGSVKTNIGHAEAAAGLAGLVKVLLCAERGTVPASLHCATPNPAIDFEGLNLRVVREPLALPDGPVLLGVNSFGWGGTNAHVVVTGPPRARPAEAAEHGTAILPLSGHNPAALAQRVQDVRDLLADGADPAHLAGALARRRDHFPHRVGVVTSGPDTAARLDAYLADAEAEVPGLVAGRAAPVGRVAFVFPGQGGQWPAMGQGLLGTDPVFTETVTRCAEALRPLVSWDLADVIAGRAGADWMASVEIVQPVLWAVSVALAEVWRAAGVTPDVVIGHSQGEVSAATVAGILSYQDAALTVVRRSRLAARASGNGRMLAVGLDAASARAALAGFEDLVSLAADNGPQSCVLSGETEAVLTLKELIETDGAFCRLVDVDYASHSPQMDELTTDLLTELSAVAPVAGRVPLMSTVRAELLHGPELDGRYWADNLRRPVLFRESMAQLFDSGVTHVVEVSPHPVLGPALEQLAAECTRPPQVLATLRRDAGSPEALALTLAKAYAAGLEPFGGLPDVPGTAVPPYPLQRSRYWVAAGTPRDARRAGFDLELAPSPVEPDRWQGGVELSTAGNPWLEDHCVYDAVVVPAAAQLSLALRTGRARTGRLPRTVTDVSFHRDLTLVDGRARVEAVWRDDVADGGSWTLLSLAPDGSAWTTHATARVRQPARDVPAPQFPVALLSAPPVEADDFYQDCAARGLQYGPAFQGVRRLHADADATLAELELPARCRSGATNGDVHPALWDAALQASLPLSGTAGTVVPVGVERLHVYAESDSPVTEAWSHAVRRSDGRYDVHLFDGARTPLLSVVGLTLRELAQDAPADPDAGRLFHLSFLDRPRSRADEPAPGWVVVGENGAALAEALSGTVAEAGRLGEPAGVVYLAPPAARGLDAQRAGLVELTGLVRACSALPVAPRLVVITADAQAVEPADRPDPGAALFWGYTRVLRREHGELAPTVLDVAAAEDWAAVAAAEVRGAEGDDQVVLRGDRRYVGRILAGTADPAGDAPAWRTPAQPCRLRPAGRAGWDGLEFRPLSRREPGPDEVEIEVTAAALNFIDVMKAMGTYPDPVGADLLGGECAGRVTRVGPQVVGVAVGDRVVACSFGAIATHLTLGARRVRPIPPSLSDPAAAALPLVTVTAWYGLVDLAGLAPGETVLVHSAAGGLGLAALGVARQRGARVIATAGTEEKRAYLRTLGVEHVFDSRGLEWADQVMAATGGRGVDVVLNSLTGAALDLGLHVLAEDGRMVEVGKKDVFSGRSIGLGAFRKGVALFAVDVAGLMERRPDRFDRAFDEAWDLVTTGELPALPIQEYPFAAAAEALRDMSRGVHTGKLVLTDPASVRAVAPEPLPQGRFRPDGTYLLTGGLGALGLSLAEFLAESGAGALALLGRTPAGPEAITRIEALRAAGVIVRSYPVDVAEPVALAAVLAEVRAELPPLRGVFHLAGLLDDATIANLRPEQLDRVLAPKVDGARHLDELTAADALDLFVLFSSAAALVGNAGQAAYAAANAYLDTLAQARRGQGVPALSVQWGPFTGIGLAAADESRGGRLAERGMGGFPAEEAWPALVRLLRAGERAAAYVPLDVRRWFDAYPDTAGLPSWQLLRDADQSGAAGAGGPFLDRLRGAEDADRGPLVHGKVRELVGKVLRLDQTAIDPQTPFKSLGLDSLMSLELRNRLEAAFGLTLSPTLLWTYGTSDALTKVLCERLPLRPEPV
ncbi:MAG TPA: type I polyketide synthase [Actinocrinis sp.]|nr:type I polyketide synthase [Actinocrinis sp.]